MLERYEKVLYEIRTIIANSEVAARLLTINTMDALEAPASLVLPDDALPYIHVNPLLSLSNSNMETGQAVFITLSFPSIDLSMTYTNAEIRIDVACAKNLYELDGNRLRLLRLSDEILYLLKGVKLSVAGQLTFDILSNIYYNKDVVGFSIIGIIQDDHYTKEIDEELEIANVEL